MTNSIAIAIAILVGGLLAADFVLSGSAGTLFALKKFSDLLEWVAFWR
ncbi:hypothetical protein [Pseudooceanicola aestuarii]|nr:hypothetical protein [Pseudooceanicola aestuarii]